ncbi:MAG: pirin family protein [Bacteroidota bacterium]
MDRKEFIKKSLLGLAASSALPAIGQAGTPEKSDSTYDKLMKDVPVDDPMRQVGFNHLPNEEIKTMKTVLHKASTRGHANHGWLKSHHSFSFANYYNPQRTNFGVLRVLNDDVVTGGMGFRTHPHDNMEIISIPLSGALRHKDTLGNTHVISKGNVQVMSAGTGIEHSEFNDSASDEVRFLQIWLFPNERNVRPRYDDIRYDPKDLHNNLVQVLSPNAEDDGVWIHQDAWFHLGEWTPGFETTYQLKRPGNGVYAFVLEGDVTIEGQKLNRRDGFGIWDVDNFRIKADSTAQFLLMEVPMQLS